MKLSLFTVQDHYPDQPRRLTDFYQQTLADCVLADALGFDTFFVAEHHFHEYGVFPNPAVFLAAAAQATQRIRLGTAVSVLPFRHPLNVAEDYALLDQLSHGRVTLGVGSGYLAHEFAGFGIDGAEKRERFDEALHLLQRAFQGERITYEGKYHQVQDVAINVRPVQQPHPPLYVAVLRAEAAYYVGRQGHRLMSVPYASCDTFADIQPMVQAYRRGCEESGHPGDIILALHAYVAESDAAARAEAAAAFDLYVATRLYARRQTYDDIMQSGLSLFGSPVTVADKLHQLAAMGVDHVALLYSFGMLAPELVTASLHRAATVRQGMESPG